MQYHFSSNPPLHVTGDQPPRQCVAQFALGRQIQTAHAPNHPDNDWRLVQPSLREAYVLPAALSEASRVTAVTHNDGDLPPVRAMLDIMHNERINHTVVSPSAQQRANSSQLGVPNDPIGGDVPEASVRSYTNAVRHSTIRGNRVRCRGSRAPPRRGAISRQRRNSQGARSPMNVLHRTTPSAQPPGRSYDYRQAVSPTVDPEDSQP
eukprot:IDg5460t1